MVHVMFNLVKDKSRRGRAHTFWGGWKKIITLTPTLLLIQYVSKLASSDWFLWSHDVRQYCGTYIQYMWRLLSTGHPIGSTMSWIIIFTASKGSVEAHKGNNTKCGCYGVTWLRAEVWITSSLFINLLGEASGWPHCCGKSIKVWMTWRFNVVQL